jgi:hypothetical protein
VPDHKAERYNVPQGKAHWWLLSANDVARWIKLLSLVMLAVSSNVYLYLELELNSFNVCTSRKRHAFTADPFVIST